MPPLAATDSVINSLVRTSQNPEDNTLWIANPVQTSIEQKIQIGDYYIIIVF